MKPLTEEQIKKIEAFILSWDAYDNCIRQIIPYRFISEFMEFLYRYKAQESAKNKTMEFTAKDAQALVDKYKNNELIRIINAIKNAASNGKNQITHSGFIKPDDRQRLILLGFSVDVSEYSVFYINW